MDDLSHLQKKLDEIGVMFYTCVGVMQRDAPPAARAPDEADETANDNAMREELAQKAPDFATQIGKSPSFVHEPAVLRMFTLGDDALHNAWS